MYSYPFSKLLPHGVIAHTNTSGGNSGWAPGVFVVCHQVLCTRNCCIGTSRTFRPENSRLLRKLKSFGIFAYGGNTGYSQPVSVKWRWWGVPLDHWAQFMSPRRFRPLAWPAALFCTPGPLLTCGQLFSQLGYARSPEPYPGSSSPPQDHLAWSALVSNLLPILPITSGFHHFALRDLLRYTLLLFSPPHSLSSHYYSPLHKSN